MQHGPPVPNLESDAPRKIQWKAVLEVLSSSHPLGSTCLHPMPAHWAGQGWTDRVVACLGLGISGGPWMALWTELTQSLPEFGSTKAKALGSAW
jgi:hypothetical protein